MIEHQTEPIHPGEILREEFLKPHGLTQRDLADQLHWTRAKVNEIVNGRRGITPDAALAFSELFGTTPEFWLNLQQQTDLWRARQKRRATA